MQIRHALSQTLGYRTDAIVRNEQRLQARRKREVGELRDVIVGEVDAFLVFGDTQVLDRGDFVA